MKLNRMQKAGLIGYALILVITIILLLTDKFSWYVFAGLLPFSAMLLIGYSINVSRRTKKSVD